MGIHMNDLLAEAIEALNGDPAPAVVAAVRDALSRLRETDDPVLALAGLDAFLEGGC
ncbi:MULTISPECIES: hypothetical protein [Nocardiopsis]|uniref:Uncharacterized protein n=1 Tax=Nocardiopsis lambiniae TaxID=3075539 RepID=A0ABU2M629_9ACTN|nr:MULTISPECIES: hypothetical protein [unclassified Nocardiopsis]MDE3723044.1 hypothetical protein [Nocardiopsis sp. N85]MDT0328033.1 hypothetical protein [Nocardiopsis sp. DSM 44743]